MFVGVRHRSSRPTGAPSPPSAPAAPSEIDGDGGYYQGTAVAGQPLGRLINNGTLSKTGGGSTSIVEADYVQGATGQVTVDCCAVLVLRRPSPVQRSGVSPAWAWALVRAERATFAICNGYDQPRDRRDEREALDPFGQPAGGQRAARGADPAAPDRRTPGRSATRSSPTPTSSPSTPPTRPRSTLRFSQADVMATPLSEVQVGHISDAGVMTKTPDCISGTLPPGAPYCVDRATAVAAPRRTPSSPC